MKTKLIIIALLIWSFNSVLAQSCGTPDPINPTGYPQESPDAGLFGSSSSFCINVFFHIVQNSNGTNAFTPPNLDAIIDKLNQYYSPHNITFNNAGLSYIQISSYVNIESEREARYLGQIANKGNAINYYIVETITYDNNTRSIAGTANTIPSNNLVIRRRYVLSPISAHEMGHCLNLIHTHETRIAV